LLENVGGDGGPGSDGDLGPNLTLIHCTYDNAYTMGGAGGDGGGGGSNGGAGSGNPGAQGASGSNGCAYIYDCSLGALTCGNLYYAQSNIADMSQVGNIGSDYGANSTMPSPIP